MFYTFCNKYKFNAIRINILERLPNNLVLELLKSELFYDTTRHIQLSYFKNNFTKNFWFLTVYFLGGRGLLFYPMVTNGAYLNVFIFS